MSGAVVVTPSAGQPWATAWEQVEGMRKGAIALSLTNYDATTVPQIASGSWLEVIGSIYKWAGNDNIVGGLTNDVINYVTMVPSGAGAGAILTPTWSDTPPTWSDAYQGYFSGTTRYVGGCYYVFDDPLEWYYTKWVYNNRDSGPADKTIHVPLVGVSPGAMVYNGSHISCLAVTTGRVGVCFNHGDIVTELYTYVDAWVGGGAWEIKLRSSPYNQGGAGIVEMALTSHAGVGAQTDATIAGPLIVLPTNKYWVHLNVTDNQAKSLCFIRVSVIRIRR